MKLDNIRNIGHVSDLQSKEKEEMERELDKIIPIETNEDPFRDDDDTEQDKNYEPSPKKFKQVHNSKRKKIKPRSNSGTNDAVPLKKRKLTPRERILRLNNKIKAYKDASMKEVEPDQRISIDLDSNKLNPSVNLSKEIERPTENIQTNHDAFFDDSITENFQNEERIDTENEKLLVSTTTDEIINKTEPSTVIFDMEEPETKPLDEDKLLVLTMKIEELTGVVNSLRRQIARVEAKSMINPKSNSHALDVDQSVFVDFDSSLAVEGFPILTCGGVEKLDLKLKDASYRQKLISLLIIINGSDGTKSGRDVISSIVDALMHPSLQAQYIWKRRTQSKCNNGETMQKNRFDGFTELHSLIYAVCRHADSSYAKDDCKNDLIYKVFKYAHQRWTKNQSEGTQGESFTGKTTPPLSEQANHSRASFDVQSGRSSHDAQYWQQNCQYAGPDLYNSNYGYNYYNSSMY